MFVDKIKCLQKSYKSTRAKDVNRCEWNTALCFRRVLVHLRVFWHGAVVEEATVKSGGSRVPRLGDGALGYLSHDCAPGSQS